MKLISKIFFITLFLAITSKVLAPPLPPPGGYLKIISLENFNTTSTSTDIRWSLHDSIYSPSYYVLKYYTTDSTKFSKDTIKDFINTTYTITGLTPNTLYHYTLIIWDTNIAGKSVSNCRSSSFTTALAGISQYNSLNNYFNFKVSTEPGNGRISVIINKDNNPAEFKIINPTGQVVYSETIFGQGNLTKVFDLSSLSKGLYFIKGTTNKCVKTLKFIIY